MPRALTEFSELQRRTKISKALMGHPNFSFIKGQGYWKGKNLSINHRENLSKSKIDKKQPNISKALTGRKISLSARKKQSLSISGDKHWNWQGGTPVEINKNYTNCRWKKLRLEILKRDGYQCIICKRVLESRYLMVHHVKNYKKYRNNDGEYLITVCRGCHLKKENKLH